MSTILLSTLSTTDRKDLGERKLWCAVIRSAIDAGDKNFFRSVGGTFTQLCTLMDLPEQEIRQRILES